MVIYKNIPVHCSIIGHGRPVVFLHGFMESMRIWEPIAPILSEYFKVIMIDLLGHGQTPIVGEIHTMEEMAEGVRAVLIAEGISEAVFVGHSMGGYVALALAEKNPELFSGLCLLHSTATEDTPEKKENRLRSIRAAEANYPLFVSSGVAQLFNAKALGDFQREIDFAKEIALSNPIDGVTAALRGMRLRKDRQDVLRQTSFSKLLIIGAHDAIIEPRTLYDQAQAGYDVSCVEIATGHMGQLEAPDEVSALLKAFVMRTEC